MCPDFSNGVAVSGFLRRSAIAVHVQRTPPRIRIRPFLQTPTGARRFYSTSLTVPPCTCVWWERASSLISRYVASPCCAAHMSASPFPLLPGKRGRKPDDVRNWLTCTLNVFPWSRPPNGHRSSWQRAPGSSSVAPATKVAFLVGSGMLTRVQ